mgnify:CR=1 FL=1|jgi:hypothetical protein
MAQTNWLRRWATSKASSVIHHPSVGLIHSLSLSYPVLHPKPRGLVGKVHDAVGANDSGETEGSESPIPPSPAKMTARQKYDARIAATTRPPPAVLSAGLGPGAIVKSDPISGKVSKGFWGPGRDGASPHSVCRDRFADACSQLPCSSPAEPDRPANDSVLPRAPAILCALGPTGRVCCPYLTGDETSICAREPRPVRQYLLPRLISTCWGST